MKKWLKVGVAAITAVFSLNMTSMGETADVQQIEYKSEMVNLIAEIHNYAGEKRGKDFFLIGNGSTALFDMDVDNPQEQVERLAGNLNGVMAESIFYGYGMEMDGESPASEQEEYKRLLNDAREYGLTVLSLDYCTKKENVEESYKKNGWQKYVGWASTRRNLDYIPDAVPNKVNNKDCHKLSDIKNYMVILNPQNYPTKNLYLSTIADTDYDLIIVDLYYGGVPLTVSDIELIRYKANGGRRLVAAYMSVGEAEDYRYYWQPEWNDNPPDWLDAANDDWAGSYRAKYWRREWKDLLYGSKEAYLDKIIGAGFDGAFLDVVDGYQYFLER